MKLYSIVVLSVLIAGPSMARQSPMASRNTLNDQAFYAERLRRQMFDMPLERSAVTDPDQNPRRARRAEAAAALLNSGDCPGALALASRERDQRLATRIGQICGAATASRATGVDQQDGRGRDEPVS